MKSFYVICGETSSEFFTPFFAMSYGHSLAVYANILMNEDVEHLYIAECLTEEAFTTWQECQVVYDAGEYVDGVVMAEYSHSLEWRKANPTSIGELVA